MADQPVRDEPGRESLIYQPSEVSWAIAEFVRRPPAWTARIFVYLLTTFFVGGIIYTYFAKTAVTVQAGGRLITAQSLFPIRAAANMKVSQLKVKENQAVKRGEVLLVDENQVTRKDYDSIRQGNTQLKALIERDKANRCTRGCVDEYRRLAEGGFRIDNKSEDLRGIVAAVTNVLKEAVLSKTRTEDAGSVLAPAYASIKEAQRKLDEIRRRRAEKILAIQVEQLESQIRSAKAQIAESKNVGRSGVAEVRTRLEVTNNELMNRVEAFRANQTVLAPIDGVVNNLAVSGPGQLIGAGQDIMMLVPSNSILIAEIDIQNKDVSKIKPGQETKIKIDALPEREFGSVTGSVTEVPVNITMTPNAQGGGDSSYKVKVELSVQSLMKDGIVYPFRLGMTLNGTVIIKKESMLVLGVKKILNIKDELTGG